MSGAGVDTGTERSRSPKGCRRRHARPCTEHREAARAAATIAMAEAMTAPWRALISLACSRPFASQTSPSPRRFPTRRRARRSSSFTGSSAGIDAVVLKGLPLASRLYGDFAVRACVDIDLYVSRESRAKADVALARAGWTLAEG